MKQRGGTAAGSPYRVAVGLSGGLLLIGLVPASAMAQAMLDPADLPLSQAAINPATSSVAAIGGNQPRLLKPRFSPRFSPRFLIESKPPSQKPDRLWPTLRPELTVPQETVPQEDVVRLMLRIDERRVYVYRGDALEASYPVAVGRSGWETPTGKFEVFSTIEEPGWTNPFTNEIVPPGADNPLGDRWIAFWTDGENMIGFHGTPNRDSVGRAASHGCVRMYNEHIRELFEIVDIGTPVTVVL